MTRLHSMFASLLGASALLLASGAASAGDIQINMDQVRVVTFKTPFKSVSVGNPLIADATVIDENHLFVIGKQFGTTNLVAVDDEGNLVAEEHITVTSQRGRMITLQRGPTWSTLTCNAERCDVRPTPGDEITRFLNESQSINQREQQSLGAAAVPSPPVQ